MYRKLTEESTEPELPSSGLEGPEVASETSAASGSIGGWVWIVLFGFVIALSILANLLFTWSVLTNKNKHNVVYMVLLLMFAINLVDYGLLAFDFSLGLDHVYPHGQMACALYQSVIKSNPVVQAAAILVLVHYAAATYINNNNNGLASNLATSRPRCGRGRADNFAMFGLIMGTLCLIGILVSIPTAYLAAIVTVRDRRGQFCEVDASTITGDLNSQQRVISAYYLLYSSILPYWLPLLVSNLPAKFKLPIPDEITSDMLVMFSACGGIRTGSSMPVLTAYFPVLT